MNQSLESLGGESLNSELLERAFYAGVLNNPEFLKLESLESVIEN